MIQESLKQLALMNGEGSPIVSFCLNVDGRVASHQQNVADAHQLVRSGREALTGMGLPEAAAQGLTRDLARIEQWVRNMPSTVDSGLAIFASEPRGLWRIFQIRDGIRTGIRVDRHAWLVPLLEAAAYRPDIATAVIGRDSARFFTSNLGGIRELAPLRDDVHASAAPGSWYGLSDQNIERHIDEQVRRHIDRSLAELGRLLVLSPAEHAYVAATTAELAGETQRSMPAALKQKVIGEVGTMPLDVAPHKVEVRVREEVEGWRREADAGLRHRLREEPSLAAVGLADVLTALHQNAVSTLVLFPHTETAGFRCSACNRLYEGPVQKCPACGCDHALRVQNLQNAALNDGLVHDVDVWPLATDTGPEIAAILRFALPAKGQESLRQVG